MTVTGRRGRSWRTPTGSAPAGSPARTPRTRSGRSAFARLANGASFAAVLLAAAPVAAQEAGDPAADPAPGVARIDAAAPAAAAPAEAVPASAPAASATIPDEQGAMPDMPGQVDMMMDRGDGLTVSLGATVSEGDFGADADAEVGAVLLNLRYRLGDVRFDASIPWMSIKGTAGVFTGIDGTPLVVSRTPLLPAGTRDGVGDLTLGARWLALDEASFGADVEFSGRVKLPTASDRSGVSTGETDYAGGVEVSRRFGDFVPNARLTYRVFGDPDMIELEDGVSASVGTAVLLTDQAVAFASYDFAEAASALIGDSHEATFGASVPLGDRLRANAFASAGLSRSAPDYSLGVSLSFRFGG